MTINNLRNIWVLPSLDAETITSLFSRSSIGGSLQVCFLGRKPSDLKKAPPEADQSWAEIGQYLEGTPGFRSGGRPTSRHQRWRSCASYVDALSVLRY